ncbi:hypothetical protein TNCV_1598501 [Trichonephila clavipes]|nr:hypothetical protein TNCV_1598501 [Trichonephila clavipes]
MSLYNLLRYTSNRYLFTESNSPFQPRYPKINDENAEGAVGAYTKTKIRWLGCQRNESLIPRIKEKRVNGNAISENTPPAGGRPVEEEAKRERNRSDVTRARVEERRKGAKSPKTHSRSTKTHKDMIEILEGYFVINSGTLGQHIGFRKEDMYGKNVKKKRKKSA